MFLIGHIGLTIAIMIIGLIIFKRTDLLQKLDFRVIAVFAILPDIIDKTIGYLIFQDSLNNGRLFSHSLVFLLLFSLFFYFIVRVYWWAYVLPIATHHIFDILWDAPKSWYWPAYGWGFDRLDVDIWAHWFDALINNPYIRITEVAGILAIVIIFLYFQMYKRENFTKMIRTGKFCDRL